MSNLLVFQRKMTKTLKVCFMIDCTSSMEPWISAAKHKTLNLLEDLCEKNKDFKIYVSLIGYRDFGEEMYRVDFTEDHTKIYNKLMDMKALGGDDQAEDVAGAYSWATSLQWGADVNALFHITDAPNHGMKYHDERVEDHFPNGHPDINLLKEVRVLACREVDLTLFRLNRSTDIMYNLMEEEYLKIKDTGFRVVDFLRSRDTADNVFYTEVSSQLITSMSAEDPTS